MGEALQMRWADVDATSRLWRKPKTKNGTSHLVPLPLQVMRTIGSLPKTSDWVFTGQHGKPWSEASALKIWGLVRSRWNLDDVRLHDLRRTCASYLAMSGENLPTIQSVLNHKSLAPTSIYARLNTKATDRALQTQADRLCSLVSAVEVLPALTQKVTALQ
jgi:integrase